MIRGFTGKAISVRFGESSPIDDGYWLISLGGRGNEHHKVCVHGDPTLVAPGFPSSRFRYRLHGPQTSHYIIHNTPHREAHDDEVHLVLVSVFYRGTIGFNTKGF